MQQKKGRREEGRFLLVQTLLGLGLLGNCFLFGANSGASGCGGPRILYCCHFGHSCDLSFIQRRLHYLLRFLKGRKSYYYKPENFISVSNLIARMRKNAAGLTDH